MEVVRFADAPGYTVANHDEVSVRRLQGGEASSAAFVLVGHTIFPAGAVIPMEAGPTGKIYVVVEGSLSVEQADGVRHTLSRMDSIFVPAGEARAVVNDSGAPAAIVVVTPRRRLERRDRDVGLVTLLEYDTATRPPPQACPP